MQFESAHVCICARIRDTLLKLLGFGLRKLLVIELVLRYIYPAETILLDPFIWMAVIFHRVLRRRSPEAGNLPVVRGVCAG
jgi:hypothetical protein